MVPAQVFSSILSVTAAPGRQPATRCGSVRNSHTAGGGALTTKVLAISKAIKASLSGEELIGSFEELLLAAGIAEIEGAAGVVGAMLRGCYLDLHSAHRVDLVGNDGNGLRLLGAAELDDLREDAQRDFFGKARADVETCG